jgi:hypothetical protein
LSAGHGETPFRQRSKPRQPLVMYSEKREIARKRLHGGRDKLPKVRSTMLHDAVCNKRLLINPAGKRAVCGIDDRMHRIIDR